MVRRPSPLLASERGVVMPTGVRAVFDVLPDWVSPCRTPTLLKSRATLYLVTKTVFEKRPNVIASVPASPISLVRFV
jgi:hypothetical protein